MTKNTLLLLNNLNLIWVRFYFDERRKQNNKSKNTLIAGNLK